MELNKNARHLHRPDALDNIPAEAIDCRHYAKYGETTVRAMNTPYEVIGQQIDAIYREIGAKVMRGISYAGEDPTRISVPLEA